MNRAILISLPVLALLGCGVSKNERSVPADTNEVATVQTPSAGTNLPNAHGEDDLPSVTASPQDSKGTVKNPDSGTGAGAELPGIDGKDPGKGTPDSKDPGKEPGKEPENPGQKPPVDKPVETPECDVRVLDFEKKADGGALFLGDKIKEQYRGYGVRFEAYRRGSSSESFDALPAGHAIIFDSRLNPDASTLAKYLEISKKFGNDVGFDDDLKTTTNGNLLIIAEHTYGANPNDGIDRVSYPDDNSNGGKIKLYFDKPTRVLDMDFVATETDKSKIELWSGPSNDMKLTHSQAIPKLGARAVSKLTVGNSQYVDKLKIILNGGGAVDNIRICVKK